MSTIVSLFVLPVWVFPYIGCSREQNPRSTAHTWSHFMGEKQVNTCCSCLTEFGGIACQAYPKVERYQLLCIDSPDKCAHWAWMHISSLMRSMVRSLSCADTVPLRHMMTHRLVLTANALAGQIVTFAGLLKGLNSVGTVTASCWLTCSQQSITDNERCHLSNNMHGVD